MGRSQTIFRALVTESKLYQTPAEDSPFCNEACPSLAIRQRGYTALCWKWRRPGSPTSNVREIESVNQLSVTFLLTVASTLSGLWQGSCASRSVFHVSPRQSRLIAVVIPENESQHDWTAGTAISQPSVARAKQYIVSTSQAFCTSCTAMPISVLFIASRTMFSFSLPTSLLVKAALHEIRAVPLMASTYSFQMVSLPLADYCQVPAEGTLHRSADGREVPPSIHVKEDLLNTAVLPHVRMDDLRCSKNLEYLRRSKYVELQVFNFEKWRFLQCRPPAWRSDFHFLHNFIRSRNWRCHNPF